jgi:hypothetical protein
MALYDTREKILAHLDDNDFIYGEVVIEIDDIVNAEADEFLDLLSEELVGSDALLEIDYRPLRVDPDGRIVMGVYGNPRIVLQDFLVDLPEPVDFPQVPSDG